MSLDFGVDVPFVRHLGFELLRFEGGESELGYEALPEHFNSHSVTHGGASMTLLDVTMARAARSVQKDMGVVTIEMKTSFLQPAKGRLTARGRLLHRTPPPRQQPAPRFSVFLCRARCAALQGKCSPCHRLGA